MKKLLAVGVILLLVGVCIPSTGRVMEQSSVVSSDGKTWYVGGSGEGNYTKIQNAIDDSNWGDTVFVYNGTYVENLIINKSINLIGEERNITKIKRNEWSDVVNIIAEVVTISYFAIYSDLIECEVPCINISSNSIIIKGNNIVSKGGWGIRLNGVSDITITNNIFSDTLRDNIEIENSNNIRITNNTFHGTISSCIYGNEIPDLVIVGNTFINPYELGGWDISIDYTPNCLIKRNTFESPWGGIYLFNCKKCVFTENNFMDKKQPWWLSIVYFFPNNPIKNKHKFDNNYWFEPRTELKLIVGEYAFTGLGWMLRLILTYNMAIIPILHFDKNPAQEPYDI